MARGVSWVHNRPMRNTILSLAAMALLAPPAAHAEQGLIGRYRLAEGPDVAGELVVARDGTFQYALAAGALDESAQGRWRIVDGKTCLFTEPKPVAPQFAKAAPLAVDGATPTLLVTWPDGRGIAGVDFRIGFDTGEPAEGYTQTYGWSMRGDDIRTPRWVELSVSMYQLVSGQMAIEDKDQGTVRIILTPNDLGVVNFEAACLEAAEAMVILHRKEGDMRFRRLGD